MLSQWLLQSASRVFTIQNVSIKLSKNFGLTLFGFNLQYKMFLLNQS